MFQPSTLRTQTITVGTSATNTALTTPLCDFYEFNNDGTAAVFVEWSTAGSVVTATTTTSYPILAGQCKMVPRPANFTHLNNISGTASQTLYVTPGMVLPGSPE
jgi:hypothetical protein